MEFTIIIPHYRTGAMTAYSVSQFLKHKGRHDIKIIIGDNNAGDGSLKYLKPFEKDILIVDYPKDRMQSHGILIDYILSSGLVKSEYFITAESDSYPINSGWLDYIENLIKEGYECGGSLLKLSGGEYLHPCGAFYKTSNWEEAKKYCDSIEYKYFPNASRFENFDCHLMVHNRFLNTFLDKPEKYIELAKDYKGNTKEEMLAKADYYSPVVGPFHNGMGNLNELFATYGQRTIDSEVPHILLNNNDNLINRMGSEPGQFLTYWQLAMGKKIFQIPTETKWMLNRVNQQQEYTLMENGFKHIWGGSSYYECTVPELQDIVKSKMELIDELYNSLPDHQKI